MDNGDATQGHAMTSAEFAKLMGAYPQPAENPLPAYGGYMDDSPANFSFVNMNDNFGAETFEAQPNFNEETQKYDGTIKEIYKDPKTNTIRVKGRWYYPQRGEWVEYNHKGCQFEGCAQMYSPEWEDDDYCTSACAYGMTICGKNKPYSYTSYGSTTLIDGWEDGAYGDFCQSLTEDVVYDRDGEEQEKRIMCNDCDYEKAEYGAETFEAPYGGAGSLMDIGKATPLADFTDEELTTSSAIHGDFDQASLNYSGHQNLEVRAETFNGLSAEEYYAEMEELDDGVASITNRFGDSVGVVQVDDEDLEDVSVEITDGDGDVVYEGILGDEDVPEMEEDDFYYSENNTKKSKSIGLLALGALAGVLAYPTVLSLFTKKEEKAAETPELIESPNTGNLDPAQYEELVVESTGYAVDVIPQGLDGSFMGSRFAALPTERYVEYNEPGIGAHTDIALSRDEMYLEPEMAMVQASESVKESQAPGQSPYNSMTGEENADFDMRVLKETEVVSLDPAVKPFIPQSMSGYTGNANTPPSVFNKMFNVGVLGQTPAFVPGSGDMGSSHTGSRSATPNALGIGGSVGGPLSDQVNSNYTDGTTSMSLAQWAIENTVSQTSDTEAVVIDRSSGQMKRVRRV